MHQLCDNSLSWLLNSALSSKINCNSSSPVETLADCLLSCKSILGGKGLETFFWLEKRFIFMLSDKVLELTGLIQPVQREFNEFSKLGIQVVICLYICSVIVCILECNCTLTG